MACRVNIGQRTGKLDREVDAGKEAGRRQTGKGGRRKFGTKIIRYPSRKSRRMLAVFLISKREIFRKVKKVKELRGGVFGVRRTRNFAD
jgi:hypothetical protein